MSRPLAGLTLLEAAAVPGETLAADAVANALAPVVRAAPRPGRIAVAMSGGVDSAVALHRAGKGAVGVTLRLWLDPAGPTAERACCSPDAVIRARETCHALGLPHVTLDLREEFRQTVVQAFVDGYAGGLTPNPCMRCNGAFRFDALTEFTERIGADALWTGHYARVVRRNGMHLVARGVTPRRTSPTCSRRSIPPSSTASCSRSAVKRRPTCDARRKEPALPRRAVPRARRRASSQATTIGASCTRTGSSRRRATSSTRREPCSGITMASGDSRPDSAAASASSSREPLHVLRSDRESNALVVGPRSALGARHVAASGRLYDSVAEVDAKLRYRSPAVAAGVTPTEGGFDARASRAGRRSRPGPGGGALRG